MKLKMLISFVLVLVFMVSICCVSAFAAIDYTETYYLNGYRINGNTVLGSNIVSVSTYAENINYGKRVRMNYAYISHGGIDVLKLNEPSGYVMNGLDTYSVYVNGNTLGTLTGGWGSHWVKASSYMVWSSFDCEDDTVVGNITVEYE